MPADREERLPIYCQEMSQLISKHFSGVLDDIAAEANLKPDDDDEDLP